MKVLNIQKRIYNQPKEKLSRLLDNLASDGDMIWPYEKWPAMLFNKGLQEGSKGGHGPIRYSVEKYVPGECIQFRFSRPKSFKGIHKFEIIEIDTTKTELRHVIDMNLNFAGSISWILAIRWLHEALLRDALEKVEGNISPVYKETKWSIWIRFLRMILTQINK